MYNGIYDKERFAYLNHTLERWLKLKISGESLGDKLVSAGVKTVAVYGIGGIGEMVLLDLSASAVKVVGLIDKRAAEYTNNDYGVPVADIATYSRNIVGDIVLVTPEFYFRQIFEELKSAGVPSNKIVSLAMALE